MNYKQALNLLNDIAVKEGGRFYSEDGKLESDKPNGTYDTFEVDNVHYKCVWTSADKQYVIKIETWICDRVTLECCHKNHGWLCVKFQTKSLPENSSWDTKVHMTSFVVVEEEEGISLYLDMLARNTWYEIMKTYERW